MTTQFDFRTLKTRLVCLAGVGATFLLSGVAACSADKPSGTPTTDSPYASVGTSSAHATPLAGHFLFSRWDNTTGTFASHHVSRADGSEETRIKMPGTQGGGRWSHSGKEIAVSIELGHDRVGTAILNPHGKVNRVLTLPDKTLNMVCTVWSRDDQRLACETWDGSNPDRAGIYTVRAADGKKLKRLTSSLPGNQDLAGDYSPDGKNIVFKRTVDGENGPLMVEPVGGGEPRQIADQVVEDSGRYSPDGKTVVTANADTIVFFNVITGQITDRIAQEGHHLFGPSWSPNGTHVAYLNTLSGQHQGEIYVSHPDGSDTRNVTNTNADSETIVDWGP